MAGGSTEWRGRSVTSKVVSLFDAFHRGDVELSLNELALAALDCRLSTAYRLAPRAGAVGRPGTRRGRRLPDRAAAARGRRAGAALRRP